MKKNPVPLPARIVRTNIILTGVIPALIPWFAIFFYNVIPDPVTRLLLYAKGWLAWTFIEYCMHRWAFHKPREKGQKQTDPFNHHHHHTHPESIILTKLHRIVSISVILFSFSSLFYGHILLSYLGGLAAGAAGYVLMHWFLHQHYSAAFFPNLVRQHIWHHCKYPNKCYGITSIFWDKLFKTLPVEFKSLPQKSIHFYYANEHLDPDALCRLEKRINAESNSYEWSFN